ncbi:MAG TPA: hypothetical protein VK421_18230 [Pyrinomonadaceae bacterium]|nr:hypothetical protein [Pyrinomonadaceae bacterium]
MTKLTTPRLLCLAAAALIFVWFVAGALWWLAGYDSVGAAISDSWRTLTSNVMNLIILSDAFFFIVLVMAWVLRDARARGWLGARRWGWVVAMMLVGCPALLVYLALRPEKLRPD